MGSIPTSVLEQLSSSLSSISHSQASYAEMFQTVQHSIVWTWLNFYYLILYQWMPCSLKTESSIRPAHSVCSTKFVELNEDNSSIFKAWWSLEITKYYKKLWYFWHFDSLKFYSLFIYNLAYLWYTIVVNKIYVSLLFSFYLILL